MTVEDFATCDTTASKSEAVQHQYSTAVISTPTFMTYDTNNDYEDRQSDDNNVDDKEEGQGKMAQFTAAPIALLTHSPSSISKVSSDFKQQGSIYHAERTEDTDTSAFYSTIHSNNTHTGLEVDPDIFKASRMRPRSATLGANQDSPPIFITTLSDGEEDGDQSQGPIFDLSPGEEPSEYIPPTAPKVGGFGVETSKVEPHKEGMRSAASERVNISSDGPMTKRDSASQSWGANFWCIIEQPNGKSFFANPQTGECAWAVPTGTFVLPPRPQGQWWELYDDDRKLSYYFHTKTEERQWERPDGFVIPLAAIQESTMGKRFSRIELKRESMTRDNADYLQGKGPPLLPPQYTLAGRNSRSFKGVNGNKTERHLQRSRSQTYSTQSQELERYSSRRRERHRIATGLSTIPSSTDLLVSSPSSTNIGRKKTNHLRRPHTGTVEKSSPRPSRRSSLDLDSYGSSDTPTLFRRERDPVKRRLLNTYSNGSITNNEIGSPTIHRSSPVDPKVGPILVERKRSVSLAGCVRSPEAKAKQDPSFSFEDFAAKTFAIHRVGIFRRKCPIDRLVRWQNEPLRHSLLSLESNEFRKDAIRFFKIILRYCEDRTNPVFWPRVPSSQSGSDTGSPRLDADERTNNEGYHHFFSKKLARSTSSTDIKSNTGPKVIEEVKWMLERALAVVCLRDELFAQIMKQTTDNQNDRSWNKTWMLLCVSLTFILPSRAFQTSCIKFVKQSEQSERCQQSPNVGKMAEYCLSKLNQHIGQPFRILKIVDIQEAEKVAIEARIFGDSLINIMSRQALVYPEAQVPRILSFLKEEMLKRNCLSTVGIFRTAGDANLVQALRRRFNQGNYSLDRLFISDDDDSKDDENHILASTLKLWLRELREPLIPEHIYNDCLKASQSSSALGLVCARINRVHLLTLVFVRSFLQLFCTPAVVKKTLMSVEAIAQIFVPCFLRSPSQTLEIHRNNFQYERQVVERFLKDLPNSLLDDQLYPSSFRQLSTGNNLTERQSTAQTSLGLGENDGGLAPRSRKASSVMRG